MCLLLLNKLMSFIAAYFKNSFISEFNSQLPSGIMSSQLVENTREHSHTKMNPGKWG